MGFDLYGIKPIKKEGEYFRNNIWWWSPLWKYICSNCGNILTINDIRNGDFNNGHVITEDKAKKLSFRLDHLIKQGAVKLYEKKYIKQREELPKKTCENCCGVGIKEGKKCITCEGDGKIKQFETKYPFKEENVKEFIKFSKNSGGFSIR